MAVVDDNTDCWAHTFPEELVPEILAMVLVAWETFLKPESNAGEVATTARFRKQLLQTAELRRLPLRIDPEVEILDSTTSEVIGKLDLRLTTPQRVRDGVYFAFECKRLYASTGPGKRPMALANAYVVKGMMRYVSAQYAESVSHGGMIAYILNGKPSRALDQVRRNIRAYHGKLKMAPPGELLPSPLIKDDQVCLSEHHLDRGPFRIHHVFLAR